LCGLSGREEDDALARIFLRIPYWSLLIGVGFSPGNWKRIPKLSNIVNGYQA